MKFTVWRRHNRDVCDSTSRYDPRCGCPLHVQFVWKGAPGVFEGKKRRSKNRPQSAARAALCGGVKVVHRRILVS